MAELISITPTRRVQGLLLLKRLSFCQLQFTGSTVFGPVVNISKWHSRNKIESSPLYIYFWKIQVWIPVIIVYHKNEYIYLWTANGILFIIYYVFRFRNIFKEYRRNLHCYFENGATPLLWTFHPNIIFNRTDLFIRRLQIIEVNLSVILSDSRRSVVIVTYVRWRSCKRSFLVVFRYCGWIYKTGKDWI